MTEPKGGALADVRVVDVGGSMTAYCAKLLTELGADVLLVEPPDGAELRRHPPWLDGRPDAETSLLFAHYRAGQRSVTLDTRSDDALPILAALGRRADIVLMSPDRRRPLVGVGVDGRLTWGHPDLVVCAITHYGLTGPHAHRRVTPLVSEAASGAMYRFGPPDGPPRALPGRQAWDETGAYGTFAVLAALHARGAVGGQLVDVSVHETIASHDQQVDLFDIDATVWHRTRLVGIPPTGVWQCRDGPFNISCHQVHHWGAFLDMLGRPAELVDPLFEAPVMRQQLFDLLGELITPLLAERSRADLFERGQAVGLPCAIVYSPAEFLQDPQMVAREFSQSVTWGEREVALPASAFGAHSSVARARRAVPTLGAANRDVYVGELGFPPATLRDWEERGLV